MDRNPKASLSPREVSVLRALKRHTGRDISSDDRKLLLAMGLAVLDSETLEFSPAGRARLDLEERTNP